MCSKCGQGRDPAYGQGAIIQSKMATDENNMFSLASAPDCTEPYHGQFQGATVYVLGLGTDKEQLFRKGDWSEATKQARVQSLTLDHVLAVNLCHESVLELFQA